MARLFRWLSVIFFILALIGIPALLFSDGFHHFRFSPRYQQMGALPLILIGLSYMSFQLSVELGRSEKAKGLLLGLAFVLWGTEQLLPPSAWVTVMATYCPDHNYWTQYHLASNKNHERNQRPHTSTTPPGSGSPGTNPRSSQ